MSTEREPSSSSTNPPAVLETNEDRSKHVKERGKTTLPFPPDWEGTLGAWEEGLNAQGRRKIRADYDREEKEREELRDQT